MHITDQKEGVGTGSLSDVTDEAKLGSAKTHQSLNECQTQSAKALAL